MVKIKQVFQGFLIFQGLKRNLDHVMNDDKVKTNIMLIEEISPQETSNDAPPQQQPHQQQQQQQSQTPNIPLHHNVDPSKIYEYYANHLFPAVISSLPILFYQFAKDSQVWLRHLLQNVYEFILPKSGWSQIHAHRHEFLELWEKAITNIPNTQHKQKVADFLLNHFDQNNDGHISTSELINMTELIARLQHIKEQHSTESQSFLAWLSREWPLFDLKLGVFLYQTFGGLLLVITILSIVPGKLHRISGKILRWPILFITYLLITIELIVYIVIRLFIRIAETIFAIPKHRVLRQQMATSLSYDEWYNYASALDMSQKRDQWQETCNDSTMYRYNWSLIRQLMNDMRHARENNDSLMALAVLRQCTRKNVGGIMSEDLFSFTNTGEPKYIVSEFVDEVANTLHWVTDDALGMSVSDPSEHEARVKYERNLDKKTKDEKDKVWGLLTTLASMPFGDDADSSKAKKQSPQEILRQPSSSSSGNIPSPKFHRKQLIEFLKGARAAYGRTALCLSGGSMMGLYHLGHLQGLMETDSLPHIISGTSAGSVVASLVCTRTNEELRRDLVPELVGPRMKCFARSWPKRIKSLWKNGHMFSNDEWLDMIRWFTMDLTFEEAYKKTGRIFCITLASTTKKAPPVLINHISAPHVTIASAVIASAAVPGLVAPQSLLIKDPDGTIRSAGDETYFDGSIEHDIPVNGLAEMLNCQFIVAAQCNPHVVPFFFHSAPGRPNRWASGEQEGSWRGGFLLAALEMYLKNDMKAKFVFLNDLEAAVGFTSTMMTQQFHGSTTIVPHVRLQDFFTLFSDPTVAQVSRCMKVGAVAAYQHAAMIRLHYRVGDAIEECLKKFGIGESVAKKRPSRRATFEMSATINSPVNAENDMPSIISAALKEKLSESDSSTSVSETSFF